jgi:pimeloyl-ACP methyl ester carboxylesterase
MLHGFAADAFTWRNLSRELESDHRVIALHRPWASHAEQLAATVAELDRYQLDTPVLLGHSAGAEIAAATALAVPDRVRAMIWISPVINRGAPWLVHQLALVPGTARIAPTLLRAAARQLGPVLRTMWYDRRRVTPEVIQGYRAPLLRPGTMEALWTMTRESRPRPDALDLSSITQPCLIITGRNDRWATSHQPPQSTLVRIDNCGHFPHEEHLQRTSDEILQFLSRLPA